MYRQTLRQAFSCENISPPRVFQEKRAVNGLNIPFPRRGQSPGVIRESLNRCQVPPRPSRHCPRSVSCCPHTPVILNVVKAPCISPWKPSFCTTCRSPSSFLWNLRFSSTLSPATATPVRPAKYAETAYRHFFTLSPGEPYIVKPQETKFPIAHPITIPYLEKSDSKWVTVNPL